MRQHLFNQGLTVLEPLSDPDASDQERADIHCLNLVDCHAALICAGAVRASWLPPQLSEMRKAVGWRDGQVLLEARLPADDALLLLVDQFEELFRGVDARHSASAQDDAADKPARYGDGPGAAAQAAGSRP